MENLVTGIVAGTATDLERIRPSHKSSSRTTTKKTIMKNQLESARHLHHFPHRYLHKHHQHEASIGFISNEDLAARLIEGYLPTIVIDVRDDDVTGRQIRGALFCPEHCFGPKQVQRLVQKANETRVQCNTGISNHKCYVVFYCRDSVKKSLRCAYKFHQALSDMGQIHGISTKVLRGGAESWFKSYETDHRLVQDFDDTFSIGCSKQNHGTNNDITSR
jgi:Rhodanese-like domain.